MVTDAYRQPLARSDQHGECTVMRFQQGAGVFEKGRALGREFDVSRCPFDQSQAESVLESLELQADGRLARAHCVSRKRKAAGLGNADEGLDRVQVKGAISHIEFLSLKDLSISICNG